MSATSLRSKWAESEPQTKAALVTVLICTVLIITTMGAYGDFLGGYTDHFHHSHITWAFFNIGADIWRMPWGEGAKLAPPYPHPAVTWHQYPNEYPPGMCLVFLLPMLLGKYVSLSDREFGKITIAYLTAFMIAANWHFAALMRRLQSHVW